MERGATAVWRLGLKNGEGNVSTDSGALEDANYAYATRFEDKAGTNPEELIAAAHAACFSMALSYELEKLGLKPDRIETKARVTLAKRPEGWIITHIYLDTDAVVPDAGQSAFSEAAHTAKANCPVSRLLNAPIHLEARLNSENPELAEAG